MAALRVRVDGKRVATVCVLGILFGGVACDSASTGGPSDSSDAGAGTALDGGGGVPGTVDGGGAGLVTPGAGGVVETSDGRVKIEVPPGAVKADTAVTITPTNEYPWDGQIVPYTVYVFGPDGITFDVPVTMTIAYAKKDIQSGVDEADLRIHKVVDGSWVAVADGTVDVARGAARAQVLGFSSYGVRGLRTSNVGDAGEPPPEGELVTIAHLHDNQDPIRVYGSDVYWFEYIGSGGDHRSVLQRAPVEGGPASMLVDDLSFCAGGQDLVKVGSSVFLKCGDAIFSVPDGGGAASPHATGAAGQSTSLFLATGLATDGTSLFWVGAGGSQGSAASIATVQRMPTAASSCSSQSIAGVTCAGTDYCPGDLRPVRRATRSVGEPDYACTEQADGVLAVCCTGPETFATMRGTAEDASVGGHIVIADGYAYWVENSCHHAWLVRKPLAGGSVETLADEVEPTGWCSNSATYYGTYHDVAVGGGRVYWVKTTNHFTHDILSMPVSGGTPEVVGSMGRWGQMAADAEKVYYVETYSDRGIHARAHAGGSWAWIAKAESPIQSIALSATHVYYADVLEVSGTTAEIRRVAK